jgi:hypothetical protein
MILSCMIQLSVMTLTFLVLDEARHAGNGTPKGATMTITSGVLMLGERLSF